MHKCHSPYREPKAVIGVQLIPNGTFFQEKEMLRPYFFGSLQKCVHKKIRDFIVAKTS